MEVSCYAYEGIDAVKHALKIGLRQSTEEMPLEIRLIAPPQYVITTTTLDRTEGIAKLNTTIQASLPQLVTVITSIESQLPGQRLRKPQN